MAAGGRRARRVPPRRLRRGASLVLVRSGRRRAYETRRACARGTPPAASRRSSGRRSRRTSARSRAAISPSGGTARPARSPGAPPRRSRAPEEGDFSEREGAAGAERTRAARRSPFPGTLAAGRPHRAASSASPDAPALALLPFEETPRGVRLRLDGSRRTALARPRGNADRALFPERRDRDAPAGRRRAAPHRGERPGRPGRPRRSRAIRSVARGRSGSPGMTETGRALAVEAFAKVNRSLRVLGKRPDGYHELDTVFQTVDLTDEMDFFEGEEGRAGRLADDRGRRPSGGREQSHPPRRARPRASGSGARRGARIHLSKKIPIGGGLGGGSSNAAATLRGLVGALGAAGHRRRSARARRLPRLRRPVLPPRRPRPRPRPGRGPDAAAGRPARSGSSSSSRRFPFPRQRFTGRLSAPALTDPAAQTNLRGSESGGGPDRNDLEPAAESLRGELRRLRLALSDARRDERAPLRERLDGVRGLRRRRKRPARLRRARGASETRRWRR